MSKYRGTVGEDSRPRPVYMNPGLYLKSVAATGPSIAPNAPGGWKCPLCGSEHQYYLGWHRHLKFTHELSKDEIAGYRDGI